MTDRKTNLDVIDPGRQFGAEKEPVWASWSFDGIRFSVDEAVHAATGARLPGYGLGLSLAVNSTAVFDAYKNGKPGDFYVQAAGLAGNMIGSYAVGVGIAATLTAVGLPAVFALGSSFVVGTLAGGYTEFAAEELTRRGLKLENPVPSWTAQIAHRINPMNNISFTPKYCFPALVLICVGRDRCKLISQISVGDIVLAFDASFNGVESGLVPRRVTRIFRNVTTEWIKLSWWDGDDARELVVTPGHHFLDQFGNFPPLSEMIKDGRATIVLASGELMEVTAERIVYSAETAHLFERATVSGMSAGGAALQPVEVEGWQTYNFEVEDLHT